MLRAKGSKPAYTLFRLESVYVTYADTVIFLTSSTSNMYLLFRFKHECT
jgi:hypothetical protein